MKKKSLTTFLQGSEIVLAFVLIFIMFTTPLVVDVLLCIKFDYDLNTIEQKQIETASYLYAYAKAMLLELLVMVLLVNGHKKTSIAFTMTTGIVSFYFYNQFHFAEGIEKHSIELIYSFIFPTVTAVCSHIYIKRKQQDQQQETKQLTDYSKSLEDYEKKIDTFTATIKQQSNKINESLQLIEQLKKENQNLSNDYFNLQDVIEEVRTLEEQQRSKNKVLLVQAQEHSNKIEQQKKEIKNFRFMELEYDKATKCPHCKKRFNGGGLNRHISVCAMNPKNKKELIEK